MVFWDVFVCIVIVIPVIFLIHAKFNYVAKNPQIFKQFLFSYGNEAE